MINQTICEVCEMALEGPILDLGSHPLCDDLLPISTSQVVPTYAQVIQLCRNCLTAHQLAPVDKEILFKPGYHYRSSLTEDVLKGMRDLVSATLDFLPTNHQPKILDVGCNDGSLLGFFKDNIQCVTLGIDPTDAIREAESKVDHAFQDYFDEDLALKIFKSYGTMDLITFTNVFAHIENLPGLIKALKIIIGKSTCLVIENHYLGSILHRGQFDTFYHEHPRTYSVTSFRHIAKSLGLVITNIEFPSRYGGNIRVTMQDMKFAVKSNTIVDESNFIAEFSEMQTRFNIWKVDSRAVIDDLLKTSKLYGKALPGRAVMLISSLGISEIEMPYISEQDSSPKVGYLVPGTSIPIIKDSVFLNNPPQRIIVWAWHIVDEIINYLELAGYKGDVWVPLPKFKFYKTLE